MEIYPLAIVTPILGSASETFIQRHVNGLLPGKTIVFSEARFNFWRCNQPTSFLNILDPQQLQQIVQLLKQHKVRIMMGEYLDSSLLWFRLASQLGIKFYGHAHGYDVSQKLRQPEICSQYQQYQDAAGIITINNISIDRLTALGLPREKIHLIPCGIDDPAAVVRPHDNSPLRILAVGRMVEKKAPILVLDAFRRALAIRPGLHLDYIGDGKLFEAAQHAAKAFEITDRVTFHGAGPNEKVVELMQLADIFLQHSVTAMNGDEEGFPVSIVEALAYRLPIVATRHAGIVDQVIDGHNGYLVEEFDTAGMAARLVALADAPEQRKSFGAAGYERFLSNFTWEIERKKLIQAMDLERFS